MQCPLVRDSTNLELSVGLAGAPIVEPIRICYVLIQISPVKLIRVLFRAPAEEPRVSTARAASTDDVCAPPAGRASHATCTVSTTQPGNTQRHSRRHH